MLSLDEYIQTNNIKTVRLIKIDIEGAELSTLIGMKQLLSQSNAPDLIIEFNQFLLDKVGVSPYTIMNLLNSNGYSAYEITTLPLGLVSTDWMPESVTNLFFTKNPARVRPVLAR